MYRSLFEKGITLAQRRIMQEERRSYRASNAFVPAATILNDLKSGKLDKCTKLESRLFSFVSSAPGIHS